MGHPGGDRGPVVRRLSWRRASRHEGGGSARYPVFEPALGGPLDLEMRINRCRAEHQGAVPFAWESEELLALTAFVALSRAGCRSHGGMAPSCGRF